MAPSPSPLPNGVPQWVGPLLVGASVIMLTGAVQSAISKIDKQMVEAAVTRSIVESLCKLLEKQPQIDQRQDRELQYIRSHLGLPPPP